MRKINDLRVITITHREARLPEIGRYVLMGVDSDEALKARLEEIQQAFDFAELVYLTTCNRLLYIFKSSIHFNEDKLTAFFRATSPHLTDEDIAFAVEKCVYYEGSQAAEHVFEVASSVNSLVVGEREILRQLRTAYDKCQSFGLVGKNLSLLFRYVVEAAKAVYSNTRIGERAISVVSLAVQRLMMAKVSPDSRVVFVGAGQTNHLVCKFLKQKGFKKISVFNRTLSRAQDFSRTYGGNAFTLDELPHFTEGFDVLIVCTGATEVVVTPELYTHLLQSDASRKVVIDLSIPHNVDHSITGTHDVHMIEVEGLRQLAQENLAERHREVEAARDILREYIHEYESDHRSRFILMALSDLPEQVKEVREKACGKVFRKELDMLDPEARALLERMMDYMEKGFATIPVKVVKSALK